MSDVVPLKITWLLHMLSVAVHVHNARASCSLWITARLRIYFVLTKRLDFKLQRAPQYGRFTLFVSTFILTPYFKIFRSASSQFGIYLSEIVLLYQFFSTFLTVQSYRHLLQLQESDTRPFHRGGSHAIKCQSPFARYPQKQL